MIESLFVRRKRKGRESIDWLSRSVPHNVKVVALTSDVRYFTTGDYTLASLISLLPVGPASAAEI